jgi:hypothetical protein
LIDLAIVTPERAAFEDLLEQLGDTDDRVEIRLDRRRGERRHAEESAASEERRRRQDRRTLDLSEPLRKAGWVLIPAAARRS